MIKNVDSVHNTLIKNTTELLQKKHRDKEQAFLVEGIKNVKEALNSDFIVDKIFVNQSGLDVHFFEEICKECHLQEIELITVTEKIIEKITDTKTPQPIVAVLKKTVNEISLAGKNTIIILDELQDPGNLGTIIRTADAAGVDAIILTNNCVDIYSPKVVRSTMGSLFHLPIFIGCEKRELIKLLMDFEFTIYTTAANATNNLFTTTFEKKCAVVIGNEAHGISDAFSKAAAVELSIPIKGKAESLNAAVAAALVMYQIVKDD